MKKVIYQLFVLIFCFACKTTKSFSEKENEVLNEDNSPKIAFLTYEISKKDENLNLIITNKTFVKGKLKQKNQHNFSDGDLKFTLLDKNKVKIITFYLGNPLSKVVEYLDDNKHFKKKEINLYKNDFFVRFQLKEEIEYVRVDKVFLTKKPTHLLTTKLIK